LSGLKVIGIKISFQSKEELQLSVKELNVLKSIRNENMIQFLDNEIYVHSNWSKTEYEM